MTHVAYLTQLSVFLEDQFDSLADEGYGTLHTCQDLRVGDISENHGGLDLCFL